MIIDICRLKYLVFLGIDNALSDYEFLFGILVFTALLSEHHILWEKIRTKPSVFIVWFEHCIFLKVYRKFHRVAIFACVC